MKTTKLLIVVALFLGSAGCRKWGDLHEPAGGVPADEMEYVVLAWNDLGMHCLNPTYSEAVLLPPYNTVWALVIKRGDHPQIAVDGLTVEYRIEGNTYSHGKTDDFGGNFSEFWDYDEALFGADLANDTGLNLDDPGISNGLSGQMVAKKDHFLASGIPVTPVADNGQWNPYQVAVITVKRDKGVVAETRVTVPTSDEINCAKCHSGGKNSVFHNILASHDGLHKTTLVESKPVLCAKCHGTPALGLTEVGTSGIYLSQAIHAAHAPRNAACYDCHPGRKTKCNRSSSHSKDDGACTECHGTMDDVASSIKEGRTPWVDEPKCSSCHDKVAGVDTGDKLYRNATGHHGVYCAACHNSPHAMYPSREASDALQPEKYQGRAVSIGSCAVCHDSSRGEGFSEFGEEHGGKSGRPSACRVCHTAVKAEKSQWPHKFEWENH